MFNRFYIQKKQEYSTLYSEPYELICKHAVPKLVRDVVEINGDVSENTLDSIEKLLFAPNAENISRNKSKEPNSVTVMELYGRSGTNEKDILEAIKLLEGPSSSEISVRLGKEYVFGSEASKEDIEGFCESNINTLIENIDTKIPSAPQAESADVILENFTSAQYTELSDIKELYGIKMDIDDLMCVQNYFLSESRQPSLIEMRIIDAFFSEKFRHTTFSTFLDSLDTNDEEIKQAWQHYLSVKKENNASLSDIIASSAEESDLLIKPVTNKLKGVSIPTEKFGDLALILKNETHNRSTTLDPYNGAAGGLAGPVRDLLCAYASPVDAYRVTGSGYSYENKRNAKFAGKGYSELAAMLGIPCAKCTEIYDDTYTQKQLEVTAALALTEMSKTELLRSRTAKSGDLIYIIGAKTGPDGSLSSEKYSYGQYIPLPDPTYLNGLISLFSSDEFAKIAIEINDVGSGGIICAIGEIADGATVNLKNIPLRQELASTEKIITSETQERMIVCIRPENEQTLISLCEAQNLECGCVAILNDSGRIVINDLQDNRIASLTSEFLLSGGAEKHLRASLEDPRPFPESEPLKTAYAPTQGVNAVKKLFHGIKPDFNGAFQKAIEEVHSGNSLTADYYDKTTGGGYFYNDNFCEVALRVLKYKGTTLTSQNGEPLCSILACGTSGELSCFNPYKGAYLSVTEAILKLTAAGYGKENIYISTQEYLPKHNNNSKLLGVSVASLLGVFEAQQRLKIHSLGGRISLGSGANEIESDSTVVSFAFCLGSPNKVIPASFNGFSSVVALIRPHFEKESELPDAQSQLDLIDTVSELIDSGKVLSASVVNSQCAATAMVKMCVQNKRGVRIDKDIDAHTLFDNCYGSVLLELKSETDIPKNAELLGYISQTYDINYKDEIISISHPEDLNTSPASPQNAEKSYLYINETEDGYGKTHTVSGTPKALIAQTSFSCNSRFITTCFTSLGAEAQVFIPTYKNVEQFANEIDRCDILWLPDGAGHKNFMTALLSTQRIRESILALCKRNGLVYGCGSSFEALVNSGVMGLDTEKISFIRQSRYPTSKYCQIRVASQLSPFLRNVELKTNYRAYFYGYATTLKIDPEYLAQLAKNGQIAIQQNNDLSIDALTSANGRILGQLTQPARTQLEQYSGGAMPFIASALKNFKIGTAEKDN